jgi:chemotaxis protein MotB
LYALKTAEVVNASKVPDPLAAQHRGAPVLNEPPERDLAGALAQAVARADEGGLVAVHQEARGVVISLPEAGAFPTGQADLSQSARRVIRELAAVLASEAGEIRVEGHTDDVPIATSRFASNWELSAARATEVIRFLIAQGDIAPARLSAAGYGEFRPLAPNTSIDARARNRRVDIVILRNLESGIGNR